MSAVNKLTDLPNGNDDGQLSGVMRSHNCLRRFSRIVLVMTAAFLTIYVCIISSEQYFTYWVQTTIERTDVHVSEVAFPAVTICLNPVSQDSNNRTDTTRLNKLSSLVDSVLWRTPEGVAATAAGFAEFEDFSDYPIDTLQNLHQTKLKCEAIFRQCSWRRNIRDCCTLLRRSSLKSTCFSFNSNFVLQPVSSWPWATAGSGFGSALNVKINRHVHKQRIHTVGILIHEPGQYLGSSVVLSKDDRVAFPLQPLRFTADLDVRKRPAQMRRCLFPDEQRQSRSECIHLCHLRYIARKCHCNYVSPMAIKRAFENSTLRSCSFKDLSCFQTHRLSVFSMSNIIEESTDNVFNTTDCKCYPDCDHIQYHAAIFTESHRNTENNDSYVEVEAFFQEETLFSYRSTLYVTFVDLMVAYGGIAGLFLGVSVVGGITALLDRISCCSKPIPATKDS